MKDMVDISILIFLGKSSRGFFRSSKSGAEVRKNPLTGGCVKEVGI